jgi:hypothetical protein
MVNQKVMLESAQPRAALGLRFASLSQCAPKTLDKTRTNERI